MPEWLLIIYRRLLLSLINRQTTSCLFPLIPLNTRKREERSGGLVIEHFRIAPACIQTTHNYQRLSKCEKYMYTVQYCKEGLIAALSIWGISQRIRYGLDHVCYWPGDAKYTWNSTIACLEST